MTADPFIPNPALVEEWGNSAMTEFKRQEAEDRVEFGRSEEASRWLEMMRISKTADVSIRVYQPRSRSFPSSP